MRGLCSLSGPRQAPSSSGRYKSSLELGEFGSGDGYWWMGRSLLSSLQPGRHLLGCEQVGLSPNRQCAFKDLETLPEWQAVPDPCGDVGFPGSFNLDPVPA